MSNQSKRNSKVCCDRYRKHLRAFNGCDKSCKRIKKVVASNKDRCNSSREEESISMCVLCQRNRAPKKATKSDITLKEKKTCNNVVDCCKKCGDTSNANVKDKVNARNKYNYLYSSPALNRLTTTSITKNVRDKTHIHQYYKNEQFHESSESFNVIEHNKGASLNTIIEHPEISSSMDTVSKICSNKSDSEVDFIDPDDFESMKKLMEFRSKNYFECHSARSRISAKNNVTNQKHKCVYRFYLNDRLFPVPVTSDYQDNVRCMECQLPLKMNDDQNSINGTIQAKVKLNDQVQDMMLMLPVKNSLIIQERKKAKNRVDDTLYFGIIKLNLNGDSIFNRNVPNDSLALRYQKGYEEYTANEKYNYDNLKEDDFIII